MVGMVVGNAQSNDFFKRDTILFQNLLDRPHTLAGIDQYAILLVSQIITIAATAASKA